MPTYEHVDPEIEPVDYRFYAPDGDPWCRFGKGLECLNGDEYLNPNHRREEDGRESE